jgi:hypothetical protein
MLSFLKFLLACLFLSSTLVFAQQDRLVDSMKRELSKPPNWKDQISSADLIERSRMEHSRSREVWKELIQLAETSRAASKW